MIKRYDVPWHLGKLARRELRKKQRTACRHQGFGRNAFVACDKLVSSLSTVVCLKDPAKTTMVGFKRER
jgi:hypothetical protein